MEHDACWRSEVSVGEVLSGRTYQNGEQSRTKQAEVQARTVIGVHPINLILGSLRISLAKSFDRTPAELDSKSSWEDWRCMRGDDSGGSNSMLLRAK